MISVHRDGDIAIGLDIGGTKTAAALLDLAGVVLGSAVAPTPSADGREAVLDCAAELAAELQQRLARGRPLAAVGAAVAGVVDSRAGAVMSSTEAIADWAGTPVASALQQRLGAPVHVENDVNAMALADARLGGAQGGTVLVAAIGTGIGGAILRDGRLVRGASATCGEIGHVLVDLALDARRCACGRPGHLEAYCSGPGMLRSYRERGGEARDLRDVSARAKRGEPLALSVLATGGALLGRALGGLVNALDPAVLVLGGGVVDVGESFLAPLEAALRADALPAASASITVRTVLGGPCGAAVGAALEALREAA